MHILIFEQTKPYDNEQEWIRENNIIEPLWNKGIILPQLVVVLLDNSTDDEKQDDELELENSTDCNNDDED